MSYEKAVKDLAPCGIDCSRCVSYDNGDVVKLSKELQEKLINYEKMAKRMENFVPVLKDYDDFLKILEHFTNGKCPGCRNGEALNMSCTARTCHKDQNVDFCFQCEDYPCSKNKYNEMLHKKWKNSNDAMKTNGVKAFYDEQKKKPRY